MCSDSIVISRLFRKNSFVVIVLLLVCIWRPRTGLALDTGTAVKKEELISAILADLARVYFVDVDKRGKTYNVLVKNFTPDDDETYVIIEELNRFWIIFLPNKLKKTIGIEEVCACADFELSKVRKELVTVTREMAVKAQFKVQDVKRSENIDLDK